LIHKFELAS